MTQSQWKVDRDDRNRYNILEEVGKLRYAADCTRFDIQAAVGIISEHAASANQRVIDALVHLWRYLYYAPNATIKLYVIPNQEIKLFGFVDAAYNQEDGSSRLGGVFYH